MSWKSLSCAALFCVLASAPALAVPTVTATLLGLDTNGNWQWRLSATPDTALFTDSPNDNPNQGVGGSVAVEMGISATGRGVVANGSAATGDFIYETLGIAPSGFPDDGNGMSDLDGDTNPDEGVLSNATSDRVVAFIGSNFFTTGGSKPMLLVTTERPTTAALTTTLTSVGAYVEVGTAADGEIDDGGTLPMIAQNGLEFVLNTVYSKAVAPGNANLDGLVNVLDVGIVGLSIAGGGGPGLRWQDGDFTGEGLVNVLDVGVIGLAIAGGGVDSNWATPGSTNLTPVVGSGSGTGGVALASSSIPEPSTVLLAALAALTAVGFGRKRSK